MAEEQKSSGKQWAVNLSLLVLTILPLTLGNTSFPSGGEGGM